MNEERQADRNRVIEAKACPLLTKRPAVSPPKRELYAITPPLERRRLLHYAAMQQSYQREFQTACKDSQALTMIYEKLMQIESAMEDAEDIHTAIDGREVERDSDPGVAQSIW